ETKEPESRPYSGGLHLLGVGQSIGVASTGPFGSYVGGGISFLFSDTLGNHLLGTSFDINGGVRDISTQVLYLNSRSRWNWGAYVERVPLLSGTAQEGLATQNGNTVVVDQVDLFRQTYNEVGGMVAYPFDRATRIEFGASAQYISFTHEVRTQTFDPF